MDWAANAISLVVTAVQTNWWGALCFGTGIPSFLAAFAVGLLLAVLLGFRFCLWFFRFLPPPHQSSEAPGGHFSSRVRAYLTIQMTTRLASTIVFLQPRPTLAAVSLGQSPADAERNGSVMSYSIIFM